MNIQQIPKGDEFRGAFIAPTKNHKIITADYSAQEQRIIANRAQDSNFINFFNAGEGDIHSFIASTMFSASKGEYVEVVNDKSHPNYSLRQKGKIIGFMIAFGGSAFTLGKSLKIPTEEAEELINAFFKGFPNLKSMFETDKSFALQNGYIRIDPVTNRIRWIPEWDKYQKLAQKSYEELTREERSLKAKLRGRVERKAMNSPIQGCAGSITKTALLLLRKYIKDFGIRPTSDAKIKIVNVVHDNTSCRG